jgi:hypothetical protein
VGRVGLLATAALAIVLAISVAVVAAQPVTSPWWINADADASYTSSGIDLAIGEHSFYLDHPGMPLQDLMAMTFETRYAVHRLAGSPTSARDYAGERLLNLDDSRAYFRGWAILFFLGGALITFLAVQRLLGGPLWGLAGALLWLAAPQLSSMSIQFRPDALLAGLVVATGALIASAAEKRDAWTYALAALLLGLTITVKLHAAGLLLPFAIALLWRPPRPGWQDGFRSSLGRWLHRYRIPLVGFAGVWVLFCFVFNWSRPFTLTHEQRTTLFEVAAAVGDYLLAVALLGRTRFGRGPFSPFGGVLVAALTLGVVLPGTLFLNDLPEMLVKIIGGLTGSGVNEGIRPFATPVSSLLEGVWSTTVLVGIAGVAAVVGLIRRDPFPLIWFSGAVATGVMALARLGTIHYFEPAFVLSIPAALWLARVLPGRLAAVGAVALVAYVAHPALGTLHDSENSAVRQEQASRAFARLADRLLGPGQLALADSYASPTPDTRWFGLVHQYTAWAPVYHYRFLPSDAGSATAQDLGLRPAYFIGALPLSLGSAQQVTLGFGTYELQPLPSTFDPTAGVGAAKLVHGPGVDAPFG